MLKKSDFKDKNNSKRRFIDKRFDKKSRDKCVYKQ